MSRSVLFPANAGGVDVLFDDVGSLVVVGANGVGKSRLGHWVELNQANGREVHRISAQRSLFFDSNVTHKPIESAQTQLLYGYHDPKVATKLAHRWGGNPMSKPPNDYDVLLALIYGLERKRDSAVVAEIREGASHTAGSIQNSVLDDIKAIWKEVLPHRELKTVDDKVKASIPGGHEYDAVEMSDGERVALYLMGECLCAPKNTVLVIDEPEIHLHRAIQGRLWDQLETARPDCSFIYITHDLEFAAQRDYSRRIWIESYDGEIWNWREVPEQDDFPPAMMLQILGSRKPILFVEGESSSLDRIYRCLFPSHTIVARGSCSSVIRSVRAMAQPGIFSGHAAFGLIDRDRRSQQEIDALARENVYACPVAEVENLLCLPAVLHAAADVINAPGQASIAIEFAVGQFRSQLERHAVAFSYNEIHYQLGKFAENKRWAKSELCDDFTTHVQAIDPGGLYDAELERLQEIADSGDYLEILKVFNQKGLANQLATKIGMRSDAYQNWFFGAIDSEMQGDQGYGLLGAIREILPQIPTG